MKSKIPEEAKQYLIKKRLLGATWPELVTYLQKEFGVKVHRTNIAIWYKNTVNLENTEIDSIEFDTLDDRLKLDQRLATANARALYYRRLYNQSLQKDRKAEYLVDSIYEATIPFAKVSPIRHTKPTGKRKGESTQIVVAPLTDTHIGEDVDYQQMAGLNSYSFDIFNKRLSGWAEQVLNLVELRRASVPIDDLIVPMLGDMISGDIHDELIKTIQETLWDK